VDCVKHAAHGLGPQPRPALPARNRRLSQVLDTPGVPEYLQWDARQRGRVVVALRVFGLPVLYLLRMPRDTTDDRRSQSASSYCQRPAITFALARKLLYAILGSDQGPMSVHGQLVRVHGQFASDRAEWCEPYGRWNGRCAYNANAVVRTVRQWIATPLSRSRCGCVGCVVRGLGWGCLCRRHNPIGRLLPSHWLMLSDRWQWSFSTCYYELFSFLYFLAISTILIIAELFFYEHFFFFRPFFLRSPPRTQCRHDAPRLASSRYAYLYSVFLRIGFPIVSYRFSLRLTSFLLTLRIHDSVPSEHFDLVTFFFRLTLSIFSIPQALGTNYSRIHGSLLENHNSI